MITKESNVREVVAEHPGTRRVFDRHGLQGCGGELGPNESLEFFAAVHQMDIQQLIQELKQEAEGPGASGYVYQETLPDYIYRRFFRARCNWRPTLLPPLFRWWASPDSSR